MRLCVRVCAVCEWVLYTSQSVEGCVCVCGVGVWLLLQLSVGCSSRQQIKLKGSHTP